MYHFIHKNIRQTYMYLKDIMILAIFFSLLDHNNHRKSNNHHTQQSSKIFSVQRLIILNSRKNQISTDQHYQQGYVCCSVEYICISFSIVVNIFNLVIV